MLRLRRPLLVSLAAAAALVPAASAPAATSAQRFADAVERGKSAIRAKEGEFKAAIDAVDFDRCERALKQDPPPEREIDRFTTYLVVAAIQPMFQPSVPVLQQIVADLDAIPTTDPALKSGRAAWREITRTFAAFPVLDKPCEKLEAWARADWRASARPDLDFDAIEKLAESSDDDTTAKLARASKRMRALAVSRGDARRFTGETLFDDVEDVLDASGIVGDDDRPARSSRLRIGLDED